MAMINRLLIYLILVLRPLLGPACCKFTISCTQYAILQLKEKSFLPALWTILKRLLSCNPFF
ncbi:membrane protein insertion efficiency factor YidD [Candidatus Dependentiae bacterium]|nr:MAG: membrane protein insertion efficiency factor YidD [Candidatus Dependentiae bacterium]